MSPKRLTTTWASVDPGDRWVGVARWSVDNAGFCEMSMYVLDRTLRSLKDTAGFIATLRPNFLCVESYQQRSVGHQRFGGGQTLRLIGALELTAQCHAMNFYEVMPGNPDVELPALPLWKLFQTWRQHTDFVAFAEWRHAMSAWRIMQRGMMSHAPGLLGQVAAQRGKFDLRFGGADREGLENAELSIATCHWRLE